MPEKKQFMSIQNQKIIATISILLMAWAKLQGFSMIPKIPQWITSPLVGSLSIITLAAFGSLIAIYMLYFEY